MRILCSVCVVNRQLANLPLTYKNAIKHLKSTLALCKHPKDRNYCILLFSSNHKSGTKYDLKENVKAIITKFIAEGKATIQFKKPEHNLCIQADTTQLKNFLVLVKKVLEDRITPQDIKLSSIGVTAMNHKVVAPTKLVIKNRSQYPVKGFPRTLEVLHINDVKRLSMDMGILHLLKLRVLNLSNNLIEFLPTQLQNLPNLSEINISSNRMGSGCHRKWDWMGGKLSKTLKSLNLSKNELKFLPQQILHLHALVSLNIDNNELALLPSGIGNLRNLKVLSASNNCLLCLPGSMSKLKLDELDLFSNNTLFGQRNEEENRNLFSAAFPQTIPVCSLKEYAAKKVLMARLPFNTETLPLTLIRFLESAKFCICGEACFDKYVQTKGVLGLRTISKVLILSPVVPEFVPTDLLFCSVQCLARSKRRTLVR